MLTRLWTANFVLALWVLPGALWFATLAGFGFGTTIYFCAIGVNRPPPGLRSP